jgi:SAM-dependent methyltransferase
VASSWARELTCEAALISDSWDEGDPYERYVGRWSRRVAPLFLAWLSVPAGRRWLDVGCGTGALAATVADLCRPSAVTAVEPSPGFLRTAHRRLAGRVALHRATATALPLADASVDVTCSGLVLNFVPDQRAAVAELARVTRPGGLVAAYVWDYAGKMELMRHFWDAAVELDPAASVLDEGARFPLCHPDPLRGLFESAGLGQVEVTALDVATPFASFEDYWRPFLGGQGPAPAYAMSLAEPARDRLREAIRRRLPAGGPLALIARAWAVRGRSAAGPLG